MIRAIVLTLLLGTVSAALREIFPPEMQGFVAHNIGSKSVSVMLHVQWCGACKRTLPQFAEASSRLSSVAMAAIDVTDDSAFIQSLEITGFPALRVLPKNFPPDTPFIQWLTVPYYSRDANGIVNFIQRVEGPDFFPFKSPDMLTRPQFGHMQSLIVVGDIHAVPVDKLKRRFQILHATSISDVSDVHGFADSCKGAIEVGKTCIAVVPSVNALVSNSPVEYPVTTVGDLTDANRLEEWLSRNSFPGLWTVDEGRFQFFNDQNTFKVLITQDPDRTGSGAVNASIVAEVSECMRATTGRVSFGMINGIAFKQALADFDIAFESGDLKVLVLSDEGLDFSRYYDDVQVGNICEGVHRILAGDSEMKTRGNWVAKSIAKINRLLRVLGIESQWAKVAIGFTIGGAIAVYLALVFLRNIDDAVPPAASRKSKPD